MSSRFAKLMAAICLLLSAWGLTLLRDSESFVGAPSAGKPGPARILRFYASVGTVLPGEKALICYGVENAKSVRISPWMAGVTPSLKRCLEVFPDHTTHYTILAEGYDGGVVTRSLTLPVAAEPPAPAPVLDFAFSRGPRTEQAGQRLVVYKRQPDGSWRAAADMFSPNS